MSRASLVLDRMGESILRLSQVGNSTFIICWWASLCSLDILQKLPRTVYHLLFLGQVQRAVVPDRNQFVEKACSLQTVCFMYKGAFSHWSHQDMQVYASTR